MCDMCDIKFGQNRTDLGKCTHQCDEVQAYNSTQAFSTKTVFFGYKERQTTKEEGSKYEDKQERADVNNMFQNVFHKVLILYILTIYT